MNFVGTSERIGFGIIFILLLALSINTYFVSDCEDSKTFMKNKLYWIPLIFGIIFGAFGLFRTSYYGKVLYNSTIAAAKEAGRVGALGPTKG